MLLSLSGGPCRPFCSSSCPPLPPWVMDKERCVMRMYLLCAVVRSVRTRGLVGRSSILLCCSTRARGAEAQDWRSAHSSQDLWRCERTFGLCSKCQVLPSAWSWMNIVVFDCSSCFTEHAASPAVATAQHYSYNAFAPPYILCVTQPCKPSIPRQTVVCR